MNKKQRELQAEIAEKTMEAQGYMDAKELDKAAECVAEIEEKQKMMDLAERLANAEKAAVPEIPVEDRKLADGFTAMAKMLTRQSMTDHEKALLTGEDAANGENYLVPEDVRVAINELRRTYVSAKNLVTVERTASLTGAINFEAGVPGGLISFSDGDVIGEEAGVSFVRKAFTIGWYGKLIPISRILLGAEKAALLNYLNRWFVRNAVLTENAAIFDAIKTGYNGGTPKAVAGWKALKKSINVDLDPSCLTDGVIITNQSGFAALDAEEDNEGHPVLQANPARPTEKLFQGLVVHVFPDAQLPNIDDTHFPMIYGSTRAACTFVEHQSLEFATSEHANFTKNQNLLRVIEGFDVMSTDTSACIYGSFAATV